MSVREQGEKRCIAVRNLTKNYPIEDGGLMDSGLRGMVHYVTLTNIVGCDSSSPPDGVVDGCSCAWHFVGLLRDVRVLVAWVGEGGHVFLIHHVPDLRQDLGKWSQVDHCH